MMAGINDIFYLDRTGLHVPTLQEVADWFAEQYKSVYGNDIDLTSDSQDGQWVAIQAKAAHDVMDIAGLIYNSMSPSTAIGDGLSRNVKLNGIMRKKSTHSTVDLRIVGEVGTIITNGSVKDANENIWLLPETVTIPTGGEILVTATAEDAGAITAEINTVNVINTPTRGWQTVTNPTEATIGQAVETDAELRRRQTISVALPSQSVLGGMESAVAAVHGVSKIRAYENDTGETDENGIPAHSTSVVVKGGDVNEIAIAILTHKTIGSGTYGSTEITVYDKAGMPTKIKFSRPTEKDIYIRLTVKPLLGYLSSYETDIKNRLIEYIDGLSIGDDIYLTKLYAPILNMNSSETATFDLESVEISEDGENWQTTNIEIAYDGLAVTDSSKITVVRDD